MKKIYVAFAVMAVSALSCTKGTAVYEDTAEIGLFPVNYSMTKAAGQYGPVKDAVYPATEKFVVYAYHTPAAPGTQLSAAAEEGLTPYLNGVTFAKKADQNVWGGDGVSYYWPKSGSLFFAGYSPADAETVTSSSCSFAETGSTLTLGFTQGAYSYTDGTSTSSVSGYKMVDLMYFDAAAADISVNTGNQAKTFKHALSYLTFNLKASTGLDGIFKVTGITLKNVKSQGTFTSGSAPAWATPGDAADIVIYNDTETGMVLAEAGTLADDVLIIPQTMVTGQGTPTDNTVLVIEYAMKANATDPSISFVEMADEVIVLKGGDGSDSDTEWLMNYHYTYNLTFTAEEILIEPSVSAWATAGADITVPQE